MQQIKNTIALFVNPNHARAKQITVQLVQLLHEKKISHQVFRQHWPTRIDEFKAAYVIGGDGTLNYFINNYPQVNMPLAIFAGGTGNDFHWLLYGKVSLAQQLETVLTAAPKAVDAGMCNQQLFLNGIGIGFDGKVVQDLLGKKKRSGKTSYLFTILKNIFGFKAFNARVTSERMDKQKNLFMISIANGKRYGGGFFVAPAASVTDSLLDVMMVDNINPMQRLRYLPVIEKGNQSGLSFVDVEKVNDINIQTSQAVPAHRDGEFFTADTFNIQCLPARFQFLY